MPVPDIDLTLYVVCEVRDESLPVNTAQTPEVLVVHETELPPTVKPPATTAPGTTLPEESFTEMVA